MATKKTLKTCIIIYGYRRGEKKKVCTLIVYLTEFKIYGKVRFEGTGMEEENWVGEEGGCVDKWTRRLMEKMMNEQQRVDEWRRMVWPLGLYFLVTWSLFYWFYFFGCFVLFLFSNIFSCFWKDAVFDSKLNKNTCTAVKVKKVNWNLFYSKINLLWWRCLTERLQRWFLNLKNFSLSFSPPPLPIKEKNFEVMETKTQKYRKHMSYFVQSYVR